MTGAVLISIVVMPSIALLLKNEISCSEKLLAELLSMQRQGMGKGAHYQRCLLQMILYGYS